MTTTQRRVLDALRFAPMFPFDLYRVAFPNGKYNTQRDPGSMGGGPSRSEYAVNNYLGKLQKMGLVHRRCKFEDHCNAGKWEITGVGWMALSKESL